LEQNMLKATREAHGYKQAAESLEAQGRRTPPGAFESCCTPVSACPGACGSCDGSVKDMVQEWQKERHELVRSKFAEADYIADLNRQRA